jgi:predicted RNase H-like HicB family nuclease
MAEMTNRYPAQVFWSDDDEGFIAIAPDLPGCSAFGSTQYEALTELQTAVEAWIEATLAAGNPVPEPSRPSSDHGFSGKLLLRMPRALHARLAQGAKSENVSLNQYINFLLTSVFSMPTAKTSSLMALHSGQQTEQRPETPSARTAAWDRPLPQSSRVASRVPTLAILQGGRPWN